MNSYKGREYGFDQPTLLESAIFNVHVKIAISLTIAFICTPNIQAENGHGLWLRAKSSASVNVVCSMKSATTDIAVQELKQCWHGKKDATIVLTVSTTHRLEAMDLSLVLTEFRQILIWVSCTGSMTCCVANSPLSQSRRKYLIPRMNAGF